MVSSVLPALGFHFTSTTRLSVKEHAPETCSLNLYFRLSPLVFADLYELADYKSTYAFRHWGPSNLELPLAAVSNEESILLLHLKPEVTHLNPEVQVTVPFHARYGAVDPSSPKAYQKAEIPHPVPFLSCHSQSEILFLS